MRSSEDFRVTVRRGTKAARPTLVAHVLPIGRVTGSEPGSPASVGFVVNRGVGTAVDRNRVKRRLRHLMRSRLADVSGGSRIVVRALPAAKSASSSELADDLDEALSRAGAR